MEPHGRYPTTMEPAGDHLDDLNQPLPLQVLLGGGAWTAKSKKKFKKKYFVSREQYVKMEAPSLKGTKLYSAIRGIDTGGPSRTLFALHQGVRDVAKLGLKEYENLLAMSTVTKDWEGVVTHDDQNNLLAEYRPWQPSDFTIGGDEDEAKINDEIHKIKKVGLLQLIL